MKILSLTSSYPRGPSDPRGAFVHSSVTLLRRAGHQVELRHCDLRGDGTIFDQLRRQPWLAPSLMTQVVRALEGAQAFDRVLCHWAWPFAQVARLRGVPRASLRVWCHGSGLRLLHENGLEGVMPQVQTALVAEHQRDFLPKRLRDQAVIVPAPLDSDFPTRTGPIERRLIFVGRLSIAKGADLIPSILDDLPGWRAVVVGWGPLEGALAHDDRIDLLGALSPCQWAARVGRGVALIPSRVPEGAPLVLREFRALGLPIVARRIRGLQEAIAEDNLGALVLGDQCQNWANACRHVQHWNLPSWKEADAEADFLRFATGTSPGKYQGAAR